MGKILGKAGESLADVYDVEGSVAGTEFLDSDTVHLVHEMGGQIMSERMIAHLIRIQSGAIVASGEWDISSVTIPDCVNRILGIQVFVDVTARVDFCSVSIRDTPAATSSHSTLLWAWDSATDIEFDVRSLQGGSTANRIHLAPRPALYPFPSLMLRTGLGRLMPLIDFNGVTPAFGAGEVNATAIIYLARPDTVTPAAGDPSSHGLPIPSW